MDKIFSKKKASSDSEIITTQKSKDIPQITEHAFLIAAKENNSQTLALFLKNPYFNPNIQNKAGCTALIMATMYQHKESIDLLLQDYRVDTTIKNNVNEFAHSYLLFDNQKIESIDHTKYFRKFSLDSIVNRFVNNMRKDYISGHITTEVINIRAQAIFKKATSSELEQEEDGRKMPDESLCTATIEEIYSMLLFRLALPEK